MVNIDRNIRELDENSSCDISNWSNKLDNACKCCLVKRVPLLDKGFSAQEIVDQCIQKGHCTQELIAVLKHDAQDLTAGLRKLYTNSVIIKKENRYS